MAKSEKNVKRRKRRTGSVFFAVLITFLTLFLIFSLLSAVLIAVLFYSGTNSNELYSIVLRKDGVRVSSISASNANNSYGLYVPYGRISEIADISIVGDEEKVTLICLPSGGTVTCNADSTLIYINGSAARLSIPVIYSGGEWLLPAEIFENYIFGIQVTFDEDTHVCTIEHKSENDVTLKMTGIQEMEAPYFPESFKIYN